MIPIAVVVPEKRLLPSLAPLVRAVSRRGIPMFGFDQPVTEPIRVAIGLDGFVPQAEHRIAVDYFFDCWRHPPDPSQIMCYSTWYHNVTHAALWDREAFFVNPMCSRLIGCLWADGRPLPPDTERTLAVFFTPKMVDERRHASWFTGYYLSALREAKEQAAREGLALVVKTRAKHRDPWWLQWRKLEIVGDEESSLDLLRRAKWCVHFGSGAALEAAAMGAFAYWYPSPEAYLADSPGSDRRPAMFCYPGVSRMGAPMEAPLDPVARERFLETYVGNMDGKAASRVLDLAEGL